MLVLIIIISAGIILGGNRDLLVGCSEIPSQAGWHWALRAGSVMVTKSMSRVVWGTIGVSIQPSDFSFFRLTGKMVGITSLFCQPKKGCCISFGGEKRGRVFLFLNGTSDQALPKVKVKVKDTYTLSPDGADLVWGSIRAAWWGSRSDNTNHV